MTGDFDDIVNRTIEALEDEGFGVLSDIDMQATIKTKLEEDIHQYRILGACNPPLAHEGLTEDIEFGALLPCNLIVYETDDGDVGVSAIDPEQLIGIADNAELDSIASEVSDRYERVLGVVSNEFEAASKA